MGGDPDLVVVSPAWTQPVEGQDQWYQPLVETGLTEDRWVRGVEVRPSIEGRRIVHHVLARVVQQEEPGDFTPAIDFAGRGRVSSPSLRSARTATCSGRIRGSC